MSDINNHKSNSPELSQQMVQLIEQKRKEAIQRRNKRLMETKQQNVSSNKVQTKSNWAVSQTSTAKQIEPSTSSSTNQMTVIKSKSVIKPIVSPIKKTKPNDSSDGQNQLKPQIKGSMSLISSKRFAIDMPYNKEVIDVFKRIYSRDWNPNTKRWTFDINDYKNLLLELKNLSSVEIQFSDSIPDRIMNALIESRNRPKDPIDLSHKLGSKLMERLYSFQTDGIVFGIRTGGRCMIADDMGLGKTTQAIGIAQWFREDWPLLIICPSSLRLQWRDSIVEWLPNVTENDVLIVEKVNQSLPKISITIISYDLMARMRSQFTFDSKHIYNVVILDESHYIKSDSAARTEAVHLLAKSSKRVVLLTGTPALSRPMELFTQIKLIDPKLFTSKHEFGIRYCDAQLQQFWGKGGRGRGSGGYSQKQIWNYKGAKNLDELKIILEATLLVRRLKTEVMTDLTKKKREMIILNLKHLNEKQTSKLNYFSKIGQKLKTFSFNLDENTSLFDWYVESAIAKVEPVCNYLEQLLNKDIKLLCFCHHKQMMNGIQEILAKKQINHIRIDGSTALADRQEACNEFQTAADCRVALLSITACSTGLNLTAAHTVVFAELFWNPGILSQAEDRVHRIGQKKDVTIYYIVAKNTIDDMIWPMISKKLEILNKAGLSKDSFEKATTALNSLDAEQHLITEFFQSLDETEQKSLLEDDFDIV